jgi:hypothetical protein
MFLGDIGCPDLNPIEHIWDMLGRRIQTREPPVQNNRQLEAALHREWQQLSQQDIRRLTGGMRVVVEMGDNWLQDVSDVLITS